MSGLYFVWAVNLNRLCLRLVGLWPRTDETTKHGFTQNFRLIFVFITVTFFCIPLASAFIRVWGDMMLMIENLQMTLSAFVAWMKVILLRWKQPAFSTVVEMMQEDWMRLKMESERDVMIKWARTARIIMFCGYSMTMTAVFIVTLFPYFGLSFREFTNLTDGDRLLPVQSYYLYDVDPSPQFELTYITQIASIFFCAMIYTSTDIFLGIVIFHMCGQLENFRCRLANLVSCKHFDAVLRDNVGIHIRLIRFGRNMEDMFSLIMLGLVLYFAIILCLFGFLSLIIFSSEINGTSFSKKCYMILACTIMIGHTFLYCAAGEVLMGESEAVYYTICNLEWYKLGPRNGRTLILLMMRANVYFRINAGKIIPLTMATFCSVLKTSAGYISLLLAKKS